MKLLVLLVAMLSLGACSSFNTHSVRNPASSNDIFPPAEAGYKRVDIVIPYEEKAAQDAISIEIGIMSNNCNAISIDAKMKEESVAGYGYEYSVIRSNNSIFGTRIFCQPLAKPKFVPSSLGKIYEHPKDYPAEAPYFKVIYVPDNFTVKVKFLKVQKEVNY